MKKLLSVVLCLAMVMALASSAFAAGIPLKPAPGTGGEIGKPGGATEIRPGTGDNAGGSSSEVAPGGSSSEVAPGGSSSEVAPGTGDNAETPDTPVTPEKIILDFVDASLYNQESDTKASWQKNGIKLTMEKIHATASGGNIQNPKHDAAKYTDHTRLQKGNTVTIEYPNMKTIEFKLYNKTHTLNMHDSIDEIPGITKTKVDDTTLRVTFSEPMDKLVLDFICSAIIRLYSVEIVETFAEGEQGTPIQGPKTLTIGDKSHTTARWIYNGELTSANNFKYDMAIYDKNYQVPDTFAAYSTTAIVVLNKYGEFVRMYKANKMYDAEGEHKDYVDTKVEKQYQRAFADLQDGEIMIILHNAGNYANVKAFDLFGAATTGYFGTVAELTGFEWEKKEEEVPAETKTITIGEKTYTTAPGAWLYNQAVTAATTANYDMIIFDKNYTGEVTTNGYGCVLVLNKYGELIKIYDGANGGFWTEAGKAATTQFTTATFASVAWSELGEGETMIIFPNKGSAALSPSRTWALGLRTAGVFNLVAELTGFTWEVRQPAGGDDVVDPPVDPPVDPKPETPPTGDSTVVFFALMALSMTALAVLVSKKRAF